MKKSVGKLALNFFGAYSGVPEDPILDIRSVTNIVLKVLGGLEYLLNFSMRVNNEAQRTLIIVTIILCTSIVYSYFSLYGILSLIESVKKEKTDSYVQIGIIVLNQI